MMTALRPTLIFQIYREDIIFRILDSRNCAADRYWKTYGCKNVTSIDVLLMNTWDNFEQLLNDCANVRMRDHPTKVFIGFSKEKYN